jgi:hypothetical protein
MSSALALASVTAVLKRLIENGLVAMGVTASLGSDATVSALPPDRIDVGTEERPQLNLFLYHVTPNTGMRRLERSDGRAAAPLAIDLHYLLAAYGAQDYQIEILLGSAMQLLHGTPALKRDSIHAALQALSTQRQGDVLPAAVTALAASDLAERVEQLTICPQFLSGEEVSKLWSAFQARYRPSMAYKVSLVLIDNL